MQKEMLSEILEQNRFTSHFSLDRVRDENVSLRLNDKAASIGFIYRHIGKTDDGRTFDVEYSRQLISRGYSVLNELVENSADEDWLKPVDTPFFGTVTRIRLFSHVLFHTSHHAGQISMTLAKGK